MKPLPLALAGALALHAGVVAGVWSAGHDGRSAGARSGAVIEVDAYVAPPVAPRVPEHADVPRSTRPTPHARRSSDRNHSQASQALAAAPETVVASPVDAPTPRFHMAAVNGFVGAAPAAAMRAGPSAVAGDGDEAVPEAEVDQRAAQIAGPTPVYPPDALAQSVELEAPLVFEIVVDASGRVVSVRPLQHAGYGFDDAAVRALRAYRFSPARRHGEPVRVRMRWTVEFHLR